MLTAERLREVLSYDPDTGEFRWTDDFSAHARKGKLAGTLHKATGNRVIKIAGKAYKAQRLAWLYMTGHWPKNDCIHLNRVRHDNRFANLSDATRSQNLAHASTRKDNALGLKRVILHPYGKFVAVIAFDGKQTHLGCFDTAEEASQAYEFAAKAAFAEFARTS